jgi:mono/diheme cytochrome c family protein
MCDWLKHKEVAMRRLRWWHIPLGIAAVAFAVFWVLVLSGQKTWFSEQPPLMIIPDMDDQFRVDPQEASRFFADRRSFRTPPEHTVPRNASAYPFGQADVAEAEKRFPTAPIPATPFVLALGKNRYEAFCQPCHGPEGKGDGTVVQRGFVQPPDLTRPEALAYSDGRIFHVISAGQNIMPSYAGKLTEPERWAIVHYIRKLQQSAMTAAAVPAGAGALSQVNKRGEGQ